MNNELRKRAQDDSLSNEGLEKLTCKSELLAVDKAMIATLEWSQAKPLEGQVLFADTDEEGNFVFPKVRTGKYNVIARGRAGINDAYWKQDVWVQPGEAVTVKVASVESSCVKPE